MGGALEYERDIDEHLERITVLRIKVVDAVGDVETIGKLYERVVACAEEQIEKSCRM